MTKDEPKPRLPTVGEYVRLKGTLVEIQDVTKPVVKELDYIFEDTHARVECRINGKVVQTYGTFNNFYGQGKCVDHAIEEAKKIHDYLGHTDAELVVVKVTSRVRMRPSREQNFYDRAFVDFASLDHGSKWDVPDDVEEVVWSSKASEVAA